MAKASTKGKQVPRDRQIDLFGSGGGDRPGSARRPGTASRRVFVDPDPGELYLGNTPLEGYLKQAGLRQPLVVRRLLAEQDWSAWESRYAPSGRAPYAPRAMMGLVLFGILQGVSSLRGLEQLARRDLGCMWVSGGICPDHANIGRFIALHEDLIGGAFFEQLTRTVLRETGSEGKRLAGDATVVEAACSHYRLLKREAAREHAERTRAQAEANPEDDAAQRQAEQARQAHHQLEARVAQRRRQGKGADALRVAATEPEAMVQPLKRGRGQGPSYKPSVLCNGARVVLAHTVHPSQEAGVLAQLLSASARLTGTMPEQLLLDAGYFTDAVLETAIAEDIDLLCPEGREAGEPKRSKQRFAKSRFHYQPQEDCYRCPAGAALRPIERWAGNACSRGYTLYATSACGECGLREQCTRSAKGRRIKRFAGDEAKDAQRQVMQQPRAQQRYRARQGMVEPLFSALRELQGLTRFRRRGLAGVRTEFALHVLAHNLARAVVYRLLALIRPCRQGAQRFRPSLGTNTALSVMPSPTENARLALHQAC